MITGSPLKTEGRRGSQGRLEEGGRYWVFPETVILGRHTTEATETTITVPPSLTVQETGCGTVYPSVATLAGQPATAFPVGRSSEGLPIGLQAIGPYLEDLTPIRFAALFAREIGGFTNPEGYDA